MWTFGQGGGRVADRERRRAGRRKAEDGSGEGEAERESMRKAYSAFAMVHGSRDCDAKTEMRPYEELW